MESDRRGVHLNVGAEVTAMTRAKVVGRIAREVSAAVGVQNGSLETIARGFEERLLSRVEIIFFSEPEERRESVVGYLAIACDWDQGLLLLQSGKGKAEFSIDQGKPISGQISALLERAVAYMSETIGLLKVRSRRVSFITASGKHEEANKRLHLTPLAQDGQQLLSDVRMDRELVVSPRELSELEITFRFKKPI